MNDDTVDLDAAGEAVKKCNVEDLPAIKHWCSTGCTVLFRYMVDLVHVRLFLPLLFLDMP